jgi:hypothetical protein
VACNYGGLNSKSYSSKDVAIAKLIEEYLSQNGFFVRCDDRQIEIYLSKVVAYELSRFDTLLPSWTKNRMCKERVVNGKV